MEYKLLLDKWEAIDKAMSEIDNNDKSRYFSDFEVEVKNRVDKYKRIVNYSNYKQFPFQEELDEITENDDSY